MRLSNLQILRAFASTWVVVFHSLFVVEKYIHTSSPVLSFLGNYGYFGVDLFFVISGFVIYYATNPHTISAGGFLRKRLQRIVPPYLSLTLLYVLVWYALPQYFIDFQFSLDKLVRSLLYISFSVNAEPVLTVGWTLEYEMFFYLLSAAAILAGARWFRWIPVGIAALVVAGAIAGPTAALDPVGFFVTNPMLLEFAAGFVIARLATGVHDLLSWAAIAAALLVVYLLGGNSRAALVLAPAALLVYAAVALESRTHLPRWLDGLLGALGNASYSIYLVQVFTLPVAAKLVMLLLPSPGPLLMGAILVAFTLLCGYAFYRLVELRLLNLMRAPVLRRVPG